MLCEFPRPKDWVVTNGGRKVQRTEYDAYRGCAGSDASTDLTVSYTANGTLKMTVGVCEAGRPLTGARGWGLNLYTGDFVQSSDAADSNGM